MKVNGKKMERTAAGLRDALFDQLERLRDRTCDSEEAKAFALLANGIIGSVEVQLKFEEMKVKGTIPQHLTEMNLIPPLKVLSDQTQKEKDTGTKKNAQVSNK